MKRIKLPVIKLYAFLLVLATLFTSLPFTAFPIFSENANEECPIEITMDGEKIDELILGEYDKVTLHAKTDETLEQTFAWQIGDPQNEDRWISIQGQVSADIAVTYALISSMTDESGNARIRCKLKKGNEEYFSDPVSITVSFDAGETEQPAALETIIGSGSVKPMNSGEGGDDEYTTVTIVINYLFDNNTMAFEPYGASVATGSDFSATITSPSVVGYTPYRRVGEDYIEAATVELDYKNLTSDVTINVIYEPALVSFQVHHHMQNLYNDDYSVTYDQITIGRALTGSTVPTGLALDLPGFKALSYERLPVAADGSTVVEIRYDRNYYLVDFDMVGGYGVEPVYTRYGMPVGANTPTRHGYAFGGWELVSYDGHAPSDEQKALYDINNNRTIELPAASLRYRAIWITQQTTYTVVFWKENADDDGYSYWGHLSRGALSGDYVSGADLISQVAGITDDEYFTFNSAKTDKNVLVEGDGSTVVNVYYTRNYYKLTIKATGKCTIPTGHQHTDDCYDEICGLGHVHNEDCSPKLQCTTPVHTEHNDDCLICGMEEHRSHDSACCPKSEHTHTISCWRNIGNAVNNLKDAPKNPEDGQIYQTGTGNRKYYYIFIKGTWYGYNGFGASSGDIVDPRCGYSVEHTHGNSDCGCKISIHVHSSLCYKDVIHSHLESCYSYGCGTIEHIHSDACKRLKCGITVNHSHTANCTKSNATNVVKTVYRKYDQYIGDLWPIVDDNNVRYDSGQRWDPSESSYYSEVLVYISTMPADDFTLSLSTASHDPYTMNYYLEVLPEDRNGENVVKVDDKYYKLDFTIVAKYNYITKAEDFFNIKGFKQYRANYNFDSSDKIDLDRPSSNPVNFYYDRLDDLVLEFNNNGVTLDQHKKPNILYGASLKEYNFIPEYPTNLEPNAFEFAGWYTTPLCFDGTEVDWQTITMPAGNMMVYAKWAPIQHTVEIYTDANCQTQIGTTQIVDHKSFATAPETIPTNGNYVFQGWFYSEVVDGTPVEKAFVFTGIPVIKDLKIYAKWSSQIDVSYVIQYKLQDSAIKIADDTVGSAPAGQNKTFNAKAGTELYSGYQTGYYPLTNSHTITMTADGTHVYTFEYVYVESMPYLVRYVNAETGATISASKKVMDNTLSVVTENFLRVDHMMPDAYQKRLVLSASGSDADNDGILDTNVITFYYNQDDEHAYYRIVHYIQNMAGDSYREYRHIETVGEIGKIYTVDAITLTGFAFNASKTRVNGTVVGASGTSVSQTLGASGMLIELYYDRIEVDYTVQYLDNNGNRIIADKHGKGVFGAQIAEYAVDLTSHGYTLVSENLKSLALSANAEHNVIKFTYSQSTASIQYQVVGPTGCGYLSQYSENVLAIDGKLSGSTPTAANGYRFIGWFSDAACTSPISSAWIDSTTNKLVPEKADDAIWTNNMVFYAEFEADVTEMTIVKQGISDKDANQASLFRIQGVAGTKTEGIDVTVTIIGNGSLILAELPIGNYTVTELTEWSWRYKTDDAVKTVTVGADPSQNTVSFHNDRVIAEWLDGNAVSNNLFVNS